MKLSTDDLPTTLRVWARSGTIANPARMKSLMKKAADEIEDLREEVEELRQAVLGSEYRP